MDRSCYLSIRSSYWHKTCLALGLEAAKKLISVLTPWSMKLILILYIRTQFVPYRKPCNWLMLYNEIDCYLFWAPYKVHNNTVLTKHRMTPMVNTERNSIRNTFQVANNTCIFTSRMLKRRQLKDSVLLECDTVTGCVVPNLWNYSTVQNNILDTGCFFYLWSQHRNCITYRSCLHWHFTVPISPAVQVTLFNTQVLKFWAPDSEAALHLVTVLLKI
jgi:hypothetical protein